MLISYPILPAPTAASSEAELEAFIQKYVDTAQGLYPVSLKDRWHGGVHLKPGDAPIRAIADGEVIAYRVAVTPETYKQQDFDTSFVLLKHTTETGENTPVVFYSLYMHLANRRDLQKNQHIKQLPDWLQKAAPGSQAQAGSGQKVWRKDILGFGGQLYGNRHVHFEIFAPDISGFWKDSKALGQGANGSPDFFGDAHFVIPAGTHFLATHPDAKKHRDQHWYVAAQPEPQGEDGWSGGELSAITPVPIDSFLAGVGTEIASTDGRLFVTLGFDKGKRTATSYQIGANGDVQPIGAPVMQDDYEYNLYSIACALYPDCPSAGYEYLRFGRVLGPDTTTHQHNWQFVRYGKNPDAVGYVDLAATNISKLSDADFPWWQGWQKIDGSQDVIKEDGICDVPALQALLNIPAGKQGQSLLDPPDFASTANDPAVARKLRHLVCQFNSEWDDSDLDKRYQRLYQHAQPLEEPAAQKDFKDHVKKLAFWSTTGLNRNVWHFHPLQFIVHYRRCGWLSLPEITRVTSDASANDIARFRNPINQCTRKYLGDSPIRRSHYLGQVIHETSNLSGPMVEKGNSSASRKYESDTTYFRGPDTYAPFLLGHGYEKIHNTLGNEYAPNGTGDGIKYRGRGSLQITGRANYASYWVFRGWLDASTFDTNWWSINGWWSVPRLAAIRPAMIATPQLISARQAGNEYNPIDVGGMFWTAHQIDSACDNESITTSLAPKSDAVSIIINRYDTPTFSSRKKHVEHAKEILCDGV